MPIVIIADNYNNNTKSFFDSLTLEKYPHKKIEDIRNLTCYDTLAISRRVSAQDIYQQENAIFILIGSNALMMREKIARKEDIIVCPQSVTPKSILTKYDTIFSHKSYFNRAIRMLKEKYNETIFD